MSGFRESHRGFRWERVPSAAEGVALEHRPSHRRHAAAAAAAERLAERGTRSS